MGQKVAQGSLTPLKQSLIKTLKAGYKIISKNKAVTAAVMLFIGIWVARKQVQRLIYYPGYGRSCKENPLGYVDPTQRNMQYEELNLKTLDNINLKGWHIKHSKPECLILYFHQNAGNIGMRMDFIQFIRDSIPADIVIVAYRGYSDSDQATIDEKGLKTDAVTIIQQSLLIAETRKVPLVVYGKSLGGAVSIYACGLEEFKGKIKALILENTFTSIFDVIKDLYPFVKMFTWPLTFGMWKSINIIQNISCPILFIKCKRDKLIKKQQMDELQKKASQRTFCQQFLIENGGHNDGWSSTKDYIATLLLFFKQRNVIAQN